MPRLFRVPTGCWIIFYIYLFIYSVLDNFFIFIYIHCIYSICIWLIVFIYLHCTCIYLFVCLFANICLLYKASGRSLKTSQISWDFYRQIHRKNVWFRGKFAENFGANFTEKWSVENDWKFSAHILPESNQVKTDLPIETVFNVL